MRPARPGAVRAGLGQLAVLGFQGLEAFAPAVLGFEGVEAGGLVNV